MHGRVRVRTPQELTEKIEKEKKRKAEHLKSITEHIFEKRKNTEYDEEMMKLTRDVLSKNPDFNTLWNIRKEVMSEFKKSLNDSSINVLIQDELKLTEIGLMQNPKSYSAWFYRCWILENVASSPDWKRELNLCEKFLEIDERNFHCWDYRYFVLSHLNITYEEELQFITKKISENMSNYSAWHYRSKLMPLLYPDPDKKRLFHKDKFSDEVKFVINAVFTDPSDQSAWFYHNWLLNSFTVPLTIIHGAYHAEMRFAWISLTKVLSVNDVYVIKGLGENEWKPYGHDIFSRIWGKPVNLEEIGDDQRTISLSDGETVIDQTDLSKDFVVHDLNLTPILCDSDKEDLTTLLNSHKQLLKMEPNNKWTMLGIVSLSEKLNCEMDFSLLEKLKSLDGMRNRYYEDLVSRYKLESKLYQVEDWREKFELTNTSLTWLHRDNYFSLFREIDLSNNPLGNEVIPQIKYFISCQVLNLCNCRITDIAKFGSLENLLILNLSENEINDGKSSGLLKCTSLKRIDLRKTLINENSNLYVALGSNISTDLEILLS